MNGEALITWDPATPPPADEPAADRMIRKASLDYGPWRPSHLDEARRMLEADPDLARTTIMRPPPSVMSPQLAR